MLLNYDYSEALSQAGVNVIAYIEKIGAYCCDCTIMKAVYHRLCGQ